MILEGYSYILHTVSREKIGRRCKVVNQEFDFAIFTLMVFDEFVTKTILIR